MKQFRVFNPEHDMALANGDKHFIAPRNIREMAHDLAPLLEVVDCEHPLVWGWDMAIAEQLRREGIPTEELPSEASLTALRTHSERKMARQILYAFRADKPDGPYAGESAIIRHTEEIAAYAAQHKHIVLKDPLSSSGKGLRHVNIDENDNDNDNDNENEDEKEKDNYQRGALKKIENWANALITRHGYLTAEPFYRKEQDFAMEFYVLNGQCHFIGYSLFMTNHHGRYEESILMEDEKIEERLAHYVPRMALRELQSWVIEHHHCIIPKEWDTARFPLYFGIDMMVVETTDNGQQTTDAIQKANLQFLLHPCVEINLRLNMGIIAHEVRRRVLASQCEGTFHVAAFPTTEALHHFQQEQLLNHPATYQEEKVVSGYHPLTPIAQNTRHHAYVICKQENNR